MAEWGMPLSMAGSGSEVVVTGVAGGWRLRGRLADMGLVPGVRVRVLHGGPGGPMMIELRGSRLGLGRGVTHKILVKEEHR